jgi:Cu-processing system permease protein
MEVVDGVLAATRLFGASVHTSIQGADIALRPVFRAVAYVVFYGGLVFGILACADFGPQLLSPGRIEHLLSQPVRRWELLAGTFLGVLALAAAGALYGAGGLALLLAVKTDVWTLRPVAAALIASVTFAGLYGPMLASAVFVRSAALSAATGVALFIGGIVASNRDSILPMMQPGIARDTFESVTLVLPRISRLGDLSADLAASVEVSTRGMSELLAGLGLFGLASLMVGIWHFERQDY